jgi:hypothetical protein
MDKNRSGFENNGGWQYVLVHDTLTGAGAASNKVEIVMQALDGNDVALQTDIVDSVTNAEQYGGAHLIPLYTKSIGTKYKIILQYDTGSEVIFKRLYIYKFRYVTINRDAR